MGQRLLKTYDDLEQVTRLDIKKRFYEPIIADGLSQKNIQGYFPPFKQYVERLN